MHIWTSFTISYTLINMFNLKVTWQDMSCERACITAFCTDLANFCSWCQCKINFFFYFYCNFFNSQAIMWFFLILIVLLKVCLIFFFENSITIFHKTRFYVQILLLRGTKSFAQLYNPRFDLDCISTGYCMRSSKVVKLLVKLETGPTGLS